LLALGSSACASVGTPDAGRPPTTATDTTTPPTTSSPVTDGIDTQTRVPLPAPTTPPVATTVPASFEQAVLFAGLGGVVTLDGQIVVAPADPLVGVRADVVDDLAGGVVVLNEGDGAQSIEWIPARGDARQLLLGPQLALHDVAIVEDERVAVVTSRDASSIETQALQLVSLETGSASVVTTLAGPDATAVSVSYGGGVFGVIRVGPGCPGLDLIDVEGRVVEAPSVPTAICEARADRPIGLVDLAPDGRSMAYTEQVVNVETGRLDHTDLVVRALDSATDLLRIEVGGDAVQVSSIDWNGRHVVMAFLPIVDSGDDTVAPVPLPPRIIDVLAEDPQPQILAIEGVFGVALARVRVTVRAPS
jgi:hypothetical protein